MSDREHTLVENGATGPLPAAPAPAPPSPRQPGGCVGRFFAALLVIVITTFLAIVAAAAGLLYLGFSPDMPGQLAGRVWRLRRSRLRIARSRRRLLGRGSAARPITRY
jgi:hypothetical protein